MSTALKHLRNILPIFLIAMLVATALTPVGTAYAEGGDDPETPEATEPAPPEDGDGTGGEGDTGEADPTTDAATEGAETGETDPATDGETVADETGEADPTTDEAVEDDEAGEAESTTDEGTTSGEEEETPPDPQFCPDGTPYGDAGCEPARTTMADAITDWLGQAVDGIIYLEAGIFDGFVIDGYTGDTDLTIQGNADNAGTTVFTGVSKVINSVFSKLTFINVSFDEGLNISDTTANDGVAMDGVTADVTISNVDVSGATGDGVSIGNHDGSVTLDNVTANNTGGDGANIDNSASSGDKGVTVSNSEFSNNASGDGLNVTSNGQVRLTGVTAVGNGGQGANINNTSSTDPQYVKIIDSIFDTNGSDGLYVEASGSIYLLNVSADQTGDNGAELYAGVGTGPEGIIICTSALTNNPGFGFTADPNTGYIKIIQVNTTGNATGAFDAANFSSIYFNEICPFGQGGTSGSDGSDSKEPDEQDNTIVVDLDPDEETETTFLTYGITFPPMDIAECRGIITVPLSEKGLPAELPEADVFAGGLLIKLEGCDLPEDSAITVTFTPSVVEEEGDFVVLFWDEETSTWVEVPATVDEDNGLKLTVSWPKIGAFALVVR